MRRECAMLMLSDAVKTIEEVHNEGGKILSFKSFCGGLVCSSLAVVGESRELSLGPPALERF